MCVNERMGMPLKGSKKTGKRVIGTVSRFFLSSPFSSLGIMICILEIWGSMLKGLIK